MLIFLMLTSCFKLEKFDHREKGKTEIFETIANLAVPVIMAGTGYSAKLLLSEDIDNLGRFLLISTFSSCLSIWLTKRISKGEIQISNLLPTLSILSSYSFPIAQERLVIKTKLIDFIKDAKKLKNLNLIHDLSHDKIDALEKFITMYIDVKSDIIISNLSNTIFYGRPIPLWLSKNNSVGTYWTIFEPSINNSISSYKHSDHAFILKYSKGAKLLSKEFSDEITKYNKLNRQYIDDLSNCLSNIYEQTKNSNIFFPFIGCIVTIAIDDIARECLARISDKKISRNSESIFLGTLALAASINENLAINLPFFEIKEKGKLMFYLSSLGLMFKVTKKISKNIFNSDFSPIITTMSSLYVLNFLFSENVAKNIFFATSLASIAAVGYDCIKPSEVKKIGIIEKRVNNSESYRTGAMALDD